MNTTPKTNLYQRFLFEDLDIRGAVLRLSTEWQQMIKGRDYPPPVLELLGEMTAISALLGGQLKHEGRLTFQLRGHGPVSLLVIDCESRNETLRLRGMARSENLPGSEAIGVRQLLGDGQLVMSMDLPDSRVPFQSIVPLTGDRIATVFEHYLEQSDQQAAALVLAASDEAAVGLFVQKMPESDLRDPDGWNRIAHLLATVGRDELLSSQPEALLARLFHQETLRVYAARPVQYDCPEDWNKIRATLGALSRSELDAILDEQGEIVIRDDICNHEYRLDREALNRLLDAAKHTLH